MTAVYSGIGCLVNSPKACSLHRLHCKLCCLGLGSAKPAQPIVAASLGPRKHGVEVGRGRGGSHTVLELSMKEGMEKIASTLEPALTSACQWLGSLVLPTQMSWSLDHTHRDLSDLPAPSDLSWSSVYYYLLDRDWPHVLFSYLCISGLDLLVTLTP